MFNDQKKNDLKSLPAKKHAQSVLLLAMADHH